jgi:hypothetical protein
MVRVALLGLVCVARVEGASFLVTKVHNWIKGEANQNCEEACIANSKICVESPYVASKKSVADDVCRHLHFVSDGFPTRTVEEINQASPDDPDASVWLKAPSIANVDGQETCVWPSSEEPTKCDVRPDPGSPDVHRLCLCRTVEPPSLTPHAAISGYNDYKFAGTPERCTEQCSKIPDCKSVDWHRPAPGSWWDLFGSDDDPATGDCDLSRSSAVDVGGLKTDYFPDDYDHYDFQSHFFAGYEDLLCVDGAGCCDRTRNAAISGHNREKLSGQTVGTCAKACRQRSWCRSFDWYKDQGKCDLSDKSATQVGGLKTNYANNPYDHYECRSLYLG